MTVNVQKPHEMAALIDTQTGKLRAQLLGAMVRREAGEVFPAGDEPACGDSLCRTRDPR